MADPGRVETWLRQAEADLHASSVQAPALKECHRRYWLQQSYEKSIKAYALLRWSGGPDEDREFSRAFLLQHSPLKVVTEISSPLSKAMHLLRREVLAFVTSLDNATLLLKIDATTPRVDPAEVSYRYPFLRDGVYVPPSAFDEVDTYQGNYQGTHAAVGRLLRAVRDELRIHARGSR